MANLLLEAALKYREQGLSVIPLSPCEKIPPKDFKVIQFRERIATVEEINGWWKENPNYNIGIITGKLSGIFVVDLDKHDKDYSEETVLQYFPENLICPVVDTPRGGQHLYFQYPKNFNPTIGSRILPGVDFRGEGGYCVAPPSKNGTGTGYSWVQKFERADLPTLPNIYINKYNNIYLYIGSNKNEKSLLQGVTINLNKGTRDQSLFHVAHTMLKGGATKEDTAIVLNIIGKNCDPPFPEKEISTKIESAFERIGRKERNISREVEDWVLLQDCYFSVTSCYFELHAVTKEDKTAIRVALSRLKDKVIEKYGDREGVYRRIETNFEFITFDENEVDEVEYPVKLPLEINSIAEVSQGNIVLVAGEFNAGKTAFMLNVLKDNKGSLPIRYISSEMKKSEFKKRFASFGLPLKFWMQDGMTEYIQKSFDFHSCIKPEALNIIDYMEFKDSDYYRGAEYLTQIHDKLTTGIALVAIQKKEGTRMPRAGDMVVEKPRLAIAFSKRESSGENPEGLCEILKCKMPKLGKIDGKKLRFEIEQRGSRFKILNSWGYLKYK